MAEERKEEQLTEQQDVLSQLGIELPSLEGIENAPQSVMPQPVNLNEYVDILIAGAITALEEALSITGYTSERGKRIAKALDNLHDVIGDEVLMKVKTMITASMGGVGGMPTMGAGGIPTPTNPPIMPF